MIKLFRGVVRFYVEGFRSMTIGKTLWLIIIVKLVLMFGVLKIFFFPDYLDTRANGEKDKAEYVRNNLIETR